MQRETGARSPLARAVAAHRPGSAIPHSVVVLPSYGLPPSMVAHYGDRIPALEHRQLVTMLRLPRVPGCRMVFLTSVHPGPDVVDYLLSLVPDAQRGDVRDRLEIVSVEEPSPGSVTAKILDRPDVVARVRRLTAGRPAFVEPWNVTQQERTLARRLRLPLFGSPPGLWPLGFKSNGRALLRSAGVPVPYGCENVRTVDEVAAAVDRIRRHRAAAPGVVVKLDNSGTGDGNRILSFEGTADAAVGAGRQALEPWYLEELLQGGVVEELLSGAEVTSPSVQLEIMPDGGVHVLATHEQVLSGAAGQEYDGCRLPASPDYADQLAGYGRKVGAALAGRGVRGRLSVDFLGVRGRRGRWALYGLEVNLRRTGTMHPLAVLAHLTEGWYDERQGRWLLEDGTERCYRATDNLVDRAWLDRPPVDVVSALARAGLAFDRSRGTGVVVHMFTALRVDGRLGLTAIGRSSGHAEELYDAACETLAGDPRAVHPAAGARLSAGQLARGSFSSASTVDRSMSASRL